MRTILTAIAFLLSLAAVSSISVAGTYIVSLPQLTGEYKWPDEVPLPPYTYEGRGTYIHYMTKYAQMNAGVQFQSISQVRLHLVGSLTKLAWNSSPTNFWAFGNGYSDSFPVADLTYGWHGGPFDHTARMAGDFTELLGGQDIIGVTLSFGLLFGPPPPDFLIDPPEGVVTAASLEIDGIAIPGTLVGDCNGDERVNVGDLQILVANWNKDNTQEGFDAKADVNHDGYVNIGDLQILLGNWGNPR